MARIFMTGFEAGHTGVLDNPGGLSIETSTVRTGNYSLKVEGFNEGYVLLPGNPSEIYGRIAFYCHNGGDGGAAHYFAKFNDSAGASQIAFVRNPTTTFIEIYRGSTLIATGTISIPLSTWYVLEFHVKIDDSTGKIETKVDGVADIDFDGDTQETGNANLGQLYFGNYATDMPGNYIDDIAINDTTSPQNNSWIGRGGIYGLFPEGAGNYTQWTPSAGANYECVDEVPPNDDTDYVADDTVGHKDTYEMEDLVPTDGGIAAVQWIARAKLSAAGSGNFQRVLRYSGVDYNGSDLAVDTSYKYFQEIFDQCPDATDWSIAKVNALEAGVEIS